MPAWAGLDSINPGLGPPGTWVDIKTRAWAGLDLVDLDLGLDLGLGLLKIWAWARLGPDQVYKSRPGPAWFRPGFFYHTNL